MNISTDCDNYYNMFMSLIYEEIGIRHINNIDNLDIILYESDQLRECGNIIKNRILHTLMSRNYGITLYYYKSYNIIKISWGGNISLKNNIYENIHKIADTLHTTRVIPTCNMYFRSMKLLQTAN